MRSIKYKELREAVLLCDESEVRIILGALGSEQEVIVNMAPAGANTLIFSAAQSGNENILSLLLEAGADGRAHTVTKYSPLYTAVHNGHVRVTKMLLDKFPELIQVSGVFVFLFSCNNSRISSSFFQFATVEKWLPFHAAVINGHVEVVELLINYQYPDKLYSTYRDPKGETEWRLAFDPNAQDVTGQTALYVACLLGNRSLVEVILTNWKVACRKLVNDEPVVLGSPGKFQNLRNSSKETGSPTKRRVSYGIQSIMSRLSLGRDAEQGRNEEGEGDGEDQDEGAKGASSINPLQLDSLCGAARETALQAAVRGGYLDVVALLLAKGADPSVVAKPMEDQSDPR